MAILNQFQPRGGNAQILPFRGNLNQAPQMITDGFNPANGANPMMPPSFQPQPIQTRGVKPVRQTPPILNPSNPTFQTGGVRPSFNQPPPQQPQPQQQQFGLSGAEQAIRQGVGAGVNAIGQGQQGALNTLLGGFGQARSFINQGVNALGGGVGGGVNFGGASAQQGQAVQVDPNTGQPLFQQAAQGVNQFTQGGVDAQQRQLALTGALGQDAFDQANINNPLQDLLNRRGQQALVDANAATGGLGSGQFQTELQQLGQAQAAQDNQRQIQNLGQLSQQGLQAAGQAGQFQTAAGQQQGNLAGQNATLGTQANLQNAQSGTQASIANAGNQTQAGIAAGRNRTALQQAQAGLFGQGANLAANLAGQGAGFQFGAGQNIADLFRQGGGQIGGFRAQAGLDIAGNVGSTTSQLQQLINQQGGGLSDIIGAGAVNQGNLLTGAGNAAGGNQSDLARLLAGLSTGQGAQAGSIALAGGQTGAQANLAQGQNQQQLIQNLIASGQFAGLFNP